MQELRRLEKQWNDATRFRGVQVNLSLGSEALTLGAGTIVAKRQHDGSIVLDGEEERVLVLLSVAYGQPLDPSVLVNIRRASKAASAGDECMAAMHIALAKLPRVSDPTDAARRLFIADGLIVAGVAPRNIWKALEFDPSALDSLAKYNSAEPRVPPGSGKPSGEWTSGGTANANTAAAIGALAPVAIRAGQAVAQEAEAQAPRILAGLPGIALRLASIAARLNLPLSALIETLRASPTGGDRIVGRVGGLPDVYSERQPDELAFHLVDKSTGRTIATLFPTGVRGQYADHEAGIVAQMEGDELIVRSMIGTVSQTQARKGEPLQCPDPPLPDKDGMTGERGLRSKGYEDFMKLQTNPGNPTPPGMAYYLPDPETGKSVSFDDCQRDSTQDLMENKGIRFGFLVGPNGPSKAKENIAEEWLGQATRQVRASGGRTLVWNFAELPAMEFAQQLFRNDPLLKNIQLRYRPWVEGENLRRSGGQWKRSIYRLFLRKYLGRTREYHDANDRSADLSRRA